MHMHVQVEPYLCMCAAIAALMTIRSCVILIIEATGQVMFLFMRQKSEQCIQQTFVFQRIFSGLRKIPIYSLLDY